MIIKESEVSRSTYRIYFEDGNQKLLEGNNLEEVIKYLKSTNMLNSVYKIEKI